MTTRLKRLSAPLVVLSAGVLAVMLGSRAFSRLFTSDVRALLARAAPTIGQDVIGEEMLADLPEAVRRYLSYTGLVGKPFVRTVRLTQRGRMRPGPGQPWMALEAEEHYTVRPPGFVWAGTIRLGPVAVARARDMYADGHGHMLVKVASLFAVVNASGKEMDQGAMMRYLSEMIWFPSAFLEDNISFEAVDDRSALVTLTDRGQSACGTLFFDGDGRLTDFVAKRYRIIDGRSELETWSTPVTGYGEFEGLRLPIRGKAAWKLAVGDLEYIEVAITELEYDSADTDPARRCASASGA
ncbi:MAG: DUF6544 family protein [Solirubrobacteraceae bacterium]